MNFRPLLLAAPLLALLLGGCDGGGPASVRTDSSAVPTVAERAAILKPYVPFDRTYETLDFDIYYQNNAGGGVPGPSDWDVRVIATVPAGELVAWVPTNLPRVAKPDRAWLATVPTDLDLTGITEWYGVDYADRRDAVGIDRARRIVAYRRQAG